MRFIQNTSDFCIQLLGQQTIDSASELRPISFLVHQPVEEGLLLFNMLTTEMVLLSREEAARFVENPGSLPELVSHWFVVPKDHDDLLLSRQCREVARIIAPPVKAITGYIILPTTDCNARCYYCYELGHSRIPMSPETADHVADFIINQSHHESVHIQWFGGEPLYNKPVISQICKRLVAAGIVFDSDMVTNGYLLDEETIEEAKGLWQLKKVQITLDGTEPVYNKTKAYIYKTGNPFQTVIQNIHLLQEAGITVEIRLNVGLRNTDNISELIENLHREFQSSTNLSIYPVPLYGLGKTLQNDPRLAILFEKLEQIQAKLFNWGLFRIKPLPRAVPNRSCMANYDGSVMILPDGHLGKCEHYTDSDWFGHVDRPDYNQQVIDSYKEIAEDIPACRECAIYPFCFKLKKCKSFDFCYQELRDSFLRNARYSMLNTYEEFKKGEQDPTQEHESHDPQV